MLLGAIADDFTGGTDLAATLVREGMRVTQLVGIPDGAEIADADAVVVSLKSRTAEVGQAVADSVAAARWLQAHGASQLFFKYCSTFDSTPAGNIGPVAEALLALTNDVRAFVSPAYPSNRRTVYRGHLFVGDVLLADSPMRDHPLTPMRESNLVRLLAPQTGLPVSLLAHEIVARGPAEIAREAGGRDGFLVVDAIADSDLRAIGEAAAEHGLVTGGAGMALGLPDNFRRRGQLAGSGAAAPAEALSGDAVVLAGSCSAATRGQVAFAVGQGAPVLRIDPLAVAAGTMTEDDLVDFAVRHRGAQPVLYSSAEPEAVRATQERLGVAASGALIETLLARVATRLAAAGFTRFIIAGGETSGAVVSALEVKQLRIGPEIATGVPWTFAPWGDRRLALALKSGNFGGEDFFQRAGRMLQ